MVTEEGMKSFKILFIVLILFMITLNLRTLNAETEDDPGKLAYKVMKTAESHKRKGEIYEAGKVYLEAAMMYKKALKEHPDERSFKTNFKYCLGTRGYIQIQKAQELLKEKKFGEAAGFFKWAADAYRLALKELPGTRNFKTNLEYAEYHGGTANFEHLLKTNGKAPILKIESFSGKQIDLGKLRGKVVLLEFWAGWCPSSRESMPLLSDLYKKFSSENFEIIAVAMCRDKTWGKYGSDKKAVETAKTYTFKFGWGDKKISNLYGNFSSVPTVIIVDKEGNLYKKISTGERTEENLTTIIKSLL